jgi:hypothetical protein
MDKNIIGGGIIFTSIKNNEIYYLLGRENKYCINGAGKYCDFGGGNDGENIIDNVSREASEEMIGYFGNKNDIKKMFEKYGYYFIDSETTKNNKIYRIYFLPINYDENIVKYFNNNQKILQEYLPNQILKKSKIFEKDKIEWFSNNDLKKRKNDLRKFFKITSKTIIKNQSKIKKFIITNCKNNNKTLKKETKKQTKKKYTQQNTKNNKQKTYKNIKI